MCHVAVLQHACRHSTHIKLTCRTLPGHKLCPSASLRTQGIYRSKLRCIECQKGVWEAQDAPAMARFYARVHDHDDGPEWTAQRAAAARKVKQALAKKRYPERREVEQKIKDAANWTFQHAKACWNIEHMRPFQTKYYHERSLVESCRYSWVRKMPDPPIWGASPEQYYRRPRQVVRLIREWSAHQNSLPPSAGMAERAAGRRLDRRTGLPLADLFLRRMARRNRATDAAEPLRASAETQKERVKFVQDWLEATSCQMKGNPMWGAPSPEGEETSALVEVTPSMMQRESLPPTEEFDEFSK